MPTSNLVILSLKVSMPGASALLAAATQQGVNAKIVTLHSDDVVSEIQTADAVIYRLGPKSYDDYAALVQRLLPESRQPLESVLVAFDKIKSYHLLAQAQVPMPATDIIEEVAAPDSFPVVVKVPRGNQGEGVELVHTAADYERIATKLFETNPQLIRQEFIAESQGSDKRIIATKNKVIGAMSRHAKPGEFRANIHQGGAATAYAPTDEEKDIAMRAIRALDLQFGGVDIIDSDRGPLVLEVNPSPGFAISSIIHKDVPAEIINEMISE